MKNQIKTTRDDETVRLLLGIELDPRLVTLLLCGNCGKRQKGQMDFSGCCPGSKVTHVQLRPADSRPS